MRLSQDDLEVVKTQLSMPSIQKFGRKTVWLLMRHIEDQEEEIKRKDKAAEHLIDALIKVRPRPTLWQRLTRWKRSNR
jgi:hypothetical protein